MSERSDPSTAAMKITGRHRFWMGFWPFQLVRFVVLNLKILKGVNAAKRS